MPLLHAPLLVPAIRLDRDDGTEEATALRRAKEPWVAGFLLFGGEAAQVARLTPQLREVADRPLFVASDMERGAGQQVQGLTTLPDAGIVGLAGTPDDAHAFGEITAREARSVGIDVLFAPVADVRSERDNPIVGNRAFGWDPTRVGALAASFCLGARAGGALPVAKHYPGHGATREDSHDAVPAVADRADLLLQRDLAPFMRVLGEGECPALMTAHVAYPALDASGVIATFSPPILARVRHDDGGTPSGPILFTDALLMAGAARDGGEVEAARRALRAGCDALLYPASPERVAAELLDDAQAHEFERLIAGAAERLRRFARQAGQGAPADMPPGLLDVPATVARRAVALATQGRLQPNPQIVWVLDDDDVAGRGAVLAEHARRRGVPCQVVRVPRGEAPRAAEDLAAYGVVVVMASVGAWKGSALARPETLCAVTDLVCCEPRSVGTRAAVWCAPGARLDGLHVPGTGAHVETALAEALFPPA